MTSHAEAFLKALTALCRQYQITLYVGGDYDDPRLCLGNLMPGELPFSAYAFFEDQTTAVPEPEERGA